MKKLLLTILLIALALTLTACKCDHAETRIVNAAKATCTEDGYTGDTVCTQCEETVTPGEVIPMTGHAYGEPRNYYDATCMQEGFTGNVVCANCGDIKKGEAIPMTDHVPSERKNVREATCTADGRTGYIICEECRTELEASETIPAFGHTLGEPLNASDATCLKEGYTGDRVCEVCQDTVKGEVTTRLAHTFENGICTACGWRTAGLYVNGKLEFTWDQMIENSYVELERNGTQLVKVVPSLYGHLVISEEITKVHAAFENSQLNAIWFPVDCVNISSNTCKNAAALEEVRFFAESVAISGRNFAGCTSLKTVILPAGQLVISEGVFENCASLEEIVLPDTISAISDNAFSGCSSLKSVILPAGLQKIDDRAFEGCTSLTELTIPEGVERIGKQVFNDSGITHIALPSTVIKLDRQHDNPAIVSVDLSKCQLTSFENGGTFSGCENLREVKLPQTLEYFSRNDFTNCPALECLDIPDGVKEIKSWGWNNEMSTNAALHTIIWPVSLTDGSLLAPIPNVQKILYCGSELQWDMTASKDMFPNAVITYNYER